MAIVRALLGAVQDAAAAVDAGHRPLHRPGEVVREPDFVRVARSRRADQLVVALDAGEHGGRRLDVFFRQAVDALNLVVALTDRD
jgi:hypothetical protein